MAKEVMVVVQPRNPAEAAQVSGRTVKELQARFHRDAGTLSPKLTPQELDTLATSVESFGANGIGPDQLEVTVVQLGRRTEGSDREVSRSKVVKPERWRGKVEGVIAERQRRAAGEPGNETLALVEQPRNAEQSGEKPHERVIRGAKAVKGKLDEEHERHVQNPDTDPQKGKQVEFVIKGIIAMVVEMIPGGIGPWGIGDIATALEAVAGRTIDGLKLSMKERLIYLGASAIPVIPARPILEAFRWYDRNRRAKQQQLPPPQQ